jgi:hypothetical protein
MKTPLAPAEANLLAWYKQTFAARTPPKSVLEAHPQYRVYWTEILAAIKEHGCFQHDVVETRLYWQRLFDAHLRRWCNRTLKDAGEQPLQRTPGERAIVRDVLKSHEG